MASHLPSTRTGVQPPQTTNQNYNQGLPELLFGWLVCFAEVPVGFQFVFLRASSLYYQKSPPP